ncbi:aromatic acid exporter family protein [Microbacterium caowuchunii]|nr:FUSC family protein [Microbacterium caowuchunii]
MRVRAVSGVMRSAGGDVADLDRLVLAAKTAVAAAIAWYLAPWVPFADADYSYYAPLGVLVSTYSTLADSARSGAQTLLGLAMGIALGFGGITVVALGGPGVVAVGLVVGVGVALGGIRALGAGREWIAMAGLFVLLLGGRDADGFSSSYLVTMAFGVVVGVTVNLLVFPPLYVQRASVRLSALRDEVAARMREMADAVAGGSIDSDELQQAMEELSATVGQVAVEVREGDRSRRGNPRGRRHREDQDRNTQRMRALERTAFFARDLADVLIEQTDRADPAVSGTVRDLLARAIQAAAELVATPAGADGGAERLDAAHTALSEYLHALDERPDAAPSGVAEELTAARCIRRIIDASRPFV